MNSDYLIMMMALPFYIVGCYFLVKWAYKQGHQSHWAHKSLFALVVFIAYNTPVGYTFIPGLIVMKSYCQEAGFTLYKTPEQWMLENPGVAETLIRPDKPDDERIIDAQGRNVLVYHLNQRFDWRTTGGDRWKNINKGIQTVVDVKTKEVMAKRIDYSLNALPIYGVESCFKKEERSKWVIDGDKFRTLLEKYFEFGERK